MAVFRAVLMCVVAAMICSSLRIQRPEIASAVALVVGLAVVALLVGEMRSAPGWENLLKMCGDDGEGLTLTVAKAGVIALIAEFGEHLCLDMGERALASRISLASRVAILGMMLPLLSRITALLEAMIP